MWGRLDLTPHGVYVYWGLIERDSDQFGIPLVRVTVPAEPETESLEGMPEEVVYFGSAAIFRIIPMSEHAVREIIFQSRHKTRTDGREN